MTEDPDDYREDIEELKNDVGGGMPGSWVFPAAVVLLLAVAGLAFVVVG